MGLFKRTEQPKPKRKPPVDETSDGIQRFFDGYFAELRTRGREHFDKTLDAYTASFKQDLEATVSSANTQLKDHIAKQIDEQIADNNAALRDGQQQVLESLKQSADALQKQHLQLTQSLQKNVADQQALLSATFEENKAQIAAMKQAQAQALEWLNQSAQAMQEQQKQLVESLQKNVAAEQTALVAAFEENMAQVVEHYLLGALGDQYDLKTQLPSIIKQMEANKKDIMDDMKL